MERGKMLGNPLKKRKKAEKRYLQRWAEIVGNSDEFDEFISNFGELVGVSKDISEEILEFVQEPKSFANLSVVNKSFGRVYTDIRAIYYVNLYNYDINTKFLKELVKFGRRHEQSNVCEFCSFEGTREYVSQNMKSYVREICKRQDLVDTLKYYEDEDSFDPYGTISSRKAYCSSVLDPSFLILSRRYLIPFPIVDWRDFKAKYESGKFDPEIEHDGFESSMLLEEILDGIDCSEKNNDDDWQAIFQREIENCFCRYGNLWWCNNV